MLAFEKTDDIGSRVMDFAVDFLHGISGFLDDTEYDMFNNSVRHSK